MNILPILPNSLIHFFFEGWENVLFELFGVTLTIYVLLWKSKIHSAVPLSKQVFVMTDIVYQHISEWCSQSLEVFCYTSATKKVPT